LQICFPTLLLLLLNAKPTASHCCCCIASMAAAILPRWWQHCCSYLQLLAPSVCIASSSTLRPHPHNIRRIRVYEEGLELFLLLLLLLGGGCLRG
jgi:hypothetical protein